MKISITNEKDEKLAGFQETPEGKFKAVILVHGFGVTKSEDGLFDELSSMLVRKGYGVFRFDFSGCGESEGDFSETTLTKLKSELDSIIAFVKSKDISSIGLVGMSFGGLVSIACEPDVDFMVIMNSPSKPAQSLRKFFGTGYNPIGISVVERSSGSVTKIKAKFWEDLENHDPLQSVQKIKCPKLFIHSELDKNVPIYEMKAYYKKAQEPKVWKTIRNVKHNFRPHRDRMYELVSDYLGRK